MSTEKQAIIKEGIRLLESFNGPNLNIFASIEMQENIEDKDKYDLFLQGFFHASMNNECSESCEKLNDFFDKQSDMSELEKFDVLNEMVQSDKLIQIFDIQHCVPSTGWSSGLRSIITSKNLSFAPK